MKNEFIKEDIGKSFKLIVKDRNTSKLSEIRGVFLGEYTTSNGIPYKQLSFYGGSKYSENNRILNLESFDYKNIQPTRLPKELGDRGRSLAKSIQQTIKKYSKFTKESEKLLYKLEVIFDNDFNLFVKKFINKYKNLNRLELINKFFEEYLPKMFIHISREDYDDQDMEEYGIQDLDETLHLSLNVRNDSYSSWVVMEYFDLDNFKIPKYKLQTITLVYPTFNLKHETIISNFIRMISKYKKKKL